jgi:hypothetical protein
MMDTYRNGLTTGNDGSEDVTLHGDTKGEGNNIEKEEVGSLRGGGLSGEDTGLDGGTVGNGLIGVDALLELLAVEVVAEKLLDLGDTSGTTNKNDLVNLLLADAGVLENLGNGVQSASEGLLVQVLETSTGNVGVEVLTVEQRVNLNSGLGGVGESTLGTLASSPETTESTGIAADVYKTVSMNSDGSVKLLLSFLRLFRELLLEVVEEVSVEVLSSQVSVTSSSLDGEDTTLDVQKRHIEGTTTKIVDEDVPLLVRLSGTETVGDSGGGGLVDNAENVEASDGTGVLSGLTLVVVEVGGHGDDGLLDLHAELGLGDLLHLLAMSVAAPPIKCLRVSYLDKDHGGDLLGRELLLLTEVLNLNERAAALVDNLEWP